MQIVLPLLAQLLMRSEALGTRRCCCRVCSHWLKARHHMPSNAAAAHATINTKRGILCQAMPHVQAKKFRSTLFEQSNGNAC